MEVERLETLQALLAATSERPARRERGELAGLRLQDLDLGPVEGALLARTDLAGLVVIGGRLSPALAAHLVRHGAIVFPSDPLAPVEVYRSRLYTAAELYDGIDGPRGYAATPDARAYAWTLDGSANADPYATLLRAIHDSSITDALDEALAGRRVVGVMGGHAAQRGSDTYAAAARLGHELATRGLVVVTGGGPGAMEAANLGARVGDLHLLSRVHRHLAAAPDYHPDLTGWARLGLHEAASLRNADAPLRSVGIPTWHYGHEPPNCFPQAVAKYFSNALREDGLLARCTAGIVALAGSAGTVQEIFQTGTRLYYDTGAGASPPPLVLVGRQLWQDVLPVWPLLSALGSARTMAGAVHLVDSVAEAVEIIAGP